MDFTGKKVAVIGLGISNAGLIRFLAGQGADVTACDRKELHGLEQILTGLEGISFKLHSGPSYLERLDEYDAIFLTPGMRRDFPELERAKTRGALISSEIKEFMNRCPGKIIGITGSSGKTTTTTLVGSIMRRDFPKVYIGGNIGTPLINHLPEMDGQTWAVLELSSFQLQETERSPEIAAITNITPNHLDMHASMEEYINAKKNIFRFQGSGGILILNHDYEITRDMASEAPGKVYFFSSRRELHEGAYLSRDQLWLKISGEPAPVCRREDLKLLGLHNVENVLLTALITSLAGVGLERIREAVTGFTGVEHRLELVRILDGVFYYNDSKSTTPTSAIAGVLAMDKPAILIAGGYDKKIPFDEFAAVVIDKCKTVVLLGDTAPLIESALLRSMKEKGRKIPVLRGKTFPEAVEMAREAAAAGDAVLLSPACASYDMFKDYNERGDLFKKIVGEFAPKG